MFPPFSAIFREALDKEKILNLQMPKRQKLFTISNAQRIVI